MSGGFTPRGLEKKLIDLNDTAPSIQQLSLWIVHHKKHYGPIVDTWFKELLRTNAAKKLSFMYLANDVVQNVRKTKPEFVLEFGEKMIDVFNHLAGQDLSDKTASSLHRLILIWEERQIFNRKLTAVLTSIWKNRGRSRERSPHTPPLPYHAPTYSPAKRPLSPATPPSPPSKRVNTVETEPHTDDKNADTDGDPDIGYREEEKVVEEREVEEKETENELDTSFGDPPDSEELIQAIQELDDTATEDAVVRNKIAQLPSDVSEAGSLVDVSTPEQAEHLLERVKSASTLLQDYNLRLENELRERRRVSRMIYEFLAAQKNQVSGLEDRIDAYKDKLDQVRSLEEEVRNHLQRLPNIPSVDNGNPFK